MQFGLAVVPGELSQLKAQARLAEDVGFDFFGVADSQSVFRELYVSLSVVAAATSRVRFGSTVSNAITRHPAVAASAIASLNELSGGRAFFGIGSGDSAILNLGLRPSRHAQLREYVSAMRTLFTGKVHSWQDKNIHVRWSKDSVPILMSAEGPKTLRLAGEIADGVIIHTGLSTDVLEDSILRIREGEKAAGKPEGSVEIWALAKCNIADRREDAVNDIKMALAASGHHSFRFTLEGKHVPDELKESIATLEREYVPAEHEMVGKPGPAAHSPWHSLWLNVGYAIIFIFPR